MRPALLTLLFAVPAFAGSLPGTQTSRITLGAVDGCHSDSECKGNRICTQNECVESQGLSSLPVPLPPPSGALLGGYEQLRVQLIDHQIQLLEFSKLSLAGPLFLTIFGGVGVLAGLALFPFGYLIFIGAVTAGSALPFLAAGLVWLFVDIGYNNRVNHAIRDLEEQKHHGARADLGSTPAMLQLASF